MAPIDFESDANQLLLNPRAVPEIRTLAERAWRELVEPHFRSHFGIMTSGSTSGSAGKLILLSRAAVLKSAHAVNSHFQVNSDDIWLKALPEFHVGGLGILARSHLNGAKVVEFSSDKWQATGFCQALQSSAATLISLVATQLFDLVQMKARAPAQVRAVIVGGGRLDPQLEAAAARLGWPTFRSYGFTECCSQVASARDVAVDRVYPLQHVEVKISDEGRICVRSDALLSAAIVLDSHAMSIVDPKLGGWFETEDYGRLSSDGALEILGRQSDFVKVSGEGVSLLRLEAILEEVKFDLKREPTVEAVVLACADNRLGARIVMVTTLSPDVAERLQQTFNVRVAPFERIRQIYYLTELPRSPIGKLLRVRTLQAVGLEPAAHV